MYPPKKEALHASTVCPGLLHQNDRGSSHHSSQVNGVYLVDQETPSSRISWPGRLHHQSCPFVKGYRQRMFYSTSSSVKNLSKSKELIYRVFLKKFVELQYLKLLRPYLNSSIVLPRSLTIYWNGSEIYSKIVPQAKYTITKQGKGVPLYMRTTG